MRLRGGTPAHTAAPSGLPEARAPVRLTSTSFSARWARIVCPSRTGQGGLSGNHYYLYSMKTAILDAPARPAVTSTIGALSDRALLRATSTLVRHERHLQGAVIDHLAEIDARRLFLQRGCSSLFDYAVRELGYSDAAAGRRIGAVRLCADQPDARERLRDGSLTLSAAAELQWAFDRQRRRGSISGTASSAPAKSAAESAPVTEEPTADSAPSAALSASDSEPPLVLDAAGRQKLVEEATGKSARQVRRMLADLDPELAVPADRMRPLGDGRYEMKAVIDADCHQGLEQLRGLLSHVDPRARSDKACWVS